MGGKEDPQGVAGRQANYRATDSRAEGSGSDPPMAFDCGTPLAQLPLREGTVLGLGFTRGARDYYSASRCIRVGAVRMTVPPIPQSAIRGSVPLSVFMRFGYPDSRSAF